MDNKKLIENVEYLTEFYSFKFKNESTTLRMWKEYISKIAIEIKECINQLFWQSEYEMLGKLLNRFDNALEHYFNKYESWDKLTLEKYSNWEHKYFKYFLGDYSFEESFPKEFVNAKINEQKVFQIEKLKSLIESYKIGSYNTESHRAPSETIQAKYKLHPKKTDKTDLIRILNAVYELKIIYKSDLVLPTKDEFMRDMGNVFGEDFSTYSKNLSQAYGGSLESNLKVFETMLENTRKAFEEKLDKKK
jgi:hypothetical protein